MKLGTSPSFILSAKPAASASCSWLLLRVELQKMVARVTQIGAALAPRVSAVTSVYAGIKAVIGDS